MCELLHLLTQYVQGNEHFDLGILSYATIEARCGYTARRSDRIVCADLQLQPRSQAKGCCAMLFPVFLILSIILVFEAQAAFPDPGNGPQEQAPCRRGQQRDRLMRGCDLRPSVTISSQGATKIARGGAGAAIPRGRLGAEEKQASWWTQCKDQVRGGR